MINPEIKEVLIPALPEHEGHRAAKVKLRWVCPICGNPRGKIKTVKSYDGSMVLFCDGWVNDCGHVDKYDDVIKEAIANGLNNPDPADADVYEKIAFVDKHLLPTLRAMGIGVKTAKYEKDLVTQEETVAITFSDARAPIKIFVTADSLLSLTADVLKGL